MAANIFYFSRVEMDLDEHDTPGPSHAKNSSADSTLCGLNTDDEYGGWVHSSLADVDGHVSCEKCMAELQKLNLIGAYAGPLAFVKESVQIDGILLEDFGWGVFDQAYEHFFAYGHHEPGVVLGLARKLSHNKLIGWEEHKTTIYAHWHSPFEPQSRDPLCCFRTWGKTDRPADNDTLKVVPVEATVIRFEAWPLLHERGRAADYDCLWLKAWYDGSTKLGRAATPADIDSADTPGFVVHGKPQGAIDELCLEWPTPDFDLAIAQMTEWHNAGATNLGILNHGIELPMDSLTPDVISRIRRGLRVYGRDMHLSDILEL
ncbi:hypothetical protein L4P27_006057 [Pseudomonas aeruginosa]|nr:hypothetical protein [Pseudomonas aeruginosa]EKV3012231.1 hypothetical protein [Pseudomonas aeruginosa]